MRFLHTADWHLGKLLRGRSRSSEHEAVLSEILDIARQGRVDCLLVCGDLFDSHAPSPEAERLAFHFFAELVGRNLPAVVIGGNHDHPRRLAALRQLLEPLSIYVRPEPATDGSDGMVEIQGNGQTARVSVLPFVSERKVTTAAQLAGPEEEVYRTYEERVSALCRALSRGFSGDTVNLLVAHLFVRGAATSGSERAIHVSRPYEVSADQMAVGADYLALGHLHRPQEVSAPAPAWYAGSTLQLDFGEQGQEKQVILVEANPGGPARVEPVELSSGRRLRDVAGTLDELTALAGRMGSDYLRVTIRVDAPVPGLVDRVRTILPAALDIRLDYPRTTTVETRCDLGKLTPEALFSEFYRSQHRDEPPEGLKELFLKLYDEASHETS